MVPMFMSKIFFLSDVHLGAHTHELEKLKEQRLISFFKMVEQEGGDLVIVGDLFDFWFEYRHVVPRRHFRVLGQLALLSAERPVHYVAGNHDFWLDSFMQAEIGLVIHQDDMIMTSGGRKIYVCHGDGLLKNDHGYRFLKKVLRSRINIFLYRLLHPDFGVPFALFFSTWSRMTGEKKSHTYKDIDYRAFAYDKIDAGFDIVVLGHTHWAALDPHGAGCYLNPGFWGLDFTYAVVDNGKPELLVWDGQKSAPFAPGLPPGNPKS